MIQIDFPERHTPARYTVREEEATEDWIGDAIQGKPPLIQRRTLGSVYHRIKGGYEQEVTQNERTHIIGRSPSLISAIAALRRFHELTGYQYAPWEEEK